MSSASWRPRSDISDAGLTVVDADHRRGVRSLARRGPIGAGAGSGHRLLRFVILLIVLFCHVLPFFPASASLRRGFCLVDFGFR
jgi:hypothetical protein